MATKKSTSRVRPSRNRDASSISADRAPGATVLKEEPELIEAIEEERHRLMKAEAVLNCVLLAMNDEQECIDEDGCEEDDECIEGHRPHYPSVLDVARDLVNQSINQLDSVRLRPMIEQIGRGGDYPVGAEQLRLGKSGKDEVKDAATVTYLY